MHLATTRLFKHLDAREGMVILDDEKLHALQLVLLESLKDILTVCSEENIPVVLGGGTCLGAVRHGGFIPWDDDIDINMSRSGYERFAPRFAERFGEKYWILDPWRTKDYPVVSPQVRRKGTVVRSRDDFKRGECGACIDICLIENVPENAVLRLAQGVASMALGLFASCRRFYQHRDSYLALAEGDEDAIRSVKLKAAIGRLLFIKSYGEWNRLWDKCNSLCRNEESRYVTVPGGRKHYFGELCKREVPFPPTTGKFEGLEVPLPHEWQLYMTQLYGEDYMTPPPDGDKEKHVVLEFDLGGANIESSPE